MNPINLATTLLGWYFRFIFWFVSWVTLAKPLSWVYVRLFRYEPEGVLRKHLSILSRMIMFCIILFYASWSVAYVVHRFHIAEHSSVGMIQNLQGQFDSLFTLNVKDNLDALKWMRENDIPFYQFFYWANIKPRPKWFLWHLWAGPISLFLFICYFIYNFRKVPFQDRKLQHSIPYVLPSMEEDGVTIGKSDFNILPKFSRQFIEKKPQDIFLPCSKLSCGTTILGGMGSGKSKLMFSIHDQIRQKYPKIPILIHDPKAEWLRTYYNPDTDIIFAPFDRRHHSWAIWNDFVQNPSLRHSIITAAVYAYHNGNVEDLWSRSSVDLIHALTFKPSLSEAKRSLKDKIQHHYEQPFISVYENSKPAFMDIARIELDARENDDPKKIMMLDDFLKWPGRIFLLNSPDCAEKQKGTFNLFLSAFLQKALSMKDVEAPELRAAVFIDEALSFHLPEQMQNRFFMMSRSKGLCIVAGAQRLPDKQRGERGSWGDTPAYTFAMRMDNLPTQETLSRQIGEMAYDKVQESTTRGEKSSTTTSEIRQHHRIVPPEHFSSLKSRDFILKHESGFVAGRTADVFHKQRDNIKEFDYVEQMSLIHFMEDL